MSTGFLVGKILSITVPGMGMLLSAAEAQAQKAIAVDGIVGSADLFANEVVASLGGDPLAGLRLSERLLAQGFTQEDLQRVHSPIGLEILAETPEEIAVSIVGELIECRARHRA